MDVVITVIGLISISFLVAWALGHFIWTGRGGDDRNEEP